LGKGVTQIDIKEAIRNEVIVIPARMSGTRLPGKPLILIAGKAMIHHVWDRCREVFPEKDIFVATEDQIIEEYCKSHKIQCVLTSSAHSAIDRVFLFSQVVKAKTYINVQGDEPIINPKDIMKVSDFSKLNREFVIIGKTAANEAEFNDFSKAKVVCDSEGKLLYSSRAGIPVDKKGQFVRAERAIWIYAFPSKSLQKYYDSFQLTHLDKIEDNEILRFLEIGDPVYCVDLIGDSWAVDELKDVAVVEARLKELNV
jgi:3-deoxy-manno-octulosonate cytidylyltransferase (CMP-KDO synthetase)